MDNHNADTNTRCAQRPLCRGQHYFRSLEEVKEFEDPYLIFIGRVMDFPDPEDIIRPFFFSKSVFNVFGYSNPEMDDLLLEAEVESSWTKRIKLFHQIVVLDTDAHMMNPF